MKKIILAVTLGAGLAGCTSPESQRNIDYDWAHHAQFVTSACVQNHLNSMSGKAVTGWDTALYEAVAKECNTLFLSSGTLREAK